MEMAAIAKRHKMDKMLEFAEVSFAPGEFARPWVVVENLAKLVSRSSMVSMFEKPKFKQFVAGLDEQNKAAFAEALEERLYGDEGQGFDRMLSMMSEAGLAKWSLISICPVYFAPCKEVYVKPTTTKGVISALELEGLVYRPKPDWDFYERYREIITEMKQLVCPSLSPSNAAFTGFLMMGLGGFDEK